MTSILIDSKTDKILAVSDVRFDVPSDQEWTVGDAIPSDVGRYFDKEIKSVVDRELKVPYRDVLAERISALEERVTALEKL